MDEVRRMELQLVTLRLNNEKLQRQLVEAEAVAMRRLDTIAELNRQLLNTEF